MTDADLCRALPPAGALPRWARGPGGSWGDSGRRIVVPLVDAGGELRSLHARTLRRDLADGQPKGLSPARHAVRGLCLPKVQPGGRGARLARGHRAQRGLTSRMCGGAWTRDILAHRCATVVQGWRAGM